MVEIGSRKDLQDWLLRQRLSWGQIVLSRAALRVLPAGLNVTRSIEDNGRYCLALFRAISLSWTARNWPAGKLNHAAFDARDMLFSAALARSNANENDAYAVAAFAALATYAVDANDASEIADAAYGAEAPTVLVSYDSIMVSHHWQSISADCNWLSEQADLEQASRVLSRRSLWLGNAPLDWRRAWDKACIEMVEQDFTFSVWASWFERRIRGEGAAFSIPGDHNRVEDKAILAQLAAATDEDFWDKGANYVNTTLQGWIDEARARAAPPAPTNTRSIISEKLLESASPQAQITDGKLDAVPNAVFDKPRYSDNLADLPSEMQAFISVLDRSLPRNCPIIIRNCIRGYDDELLVRGNRPIVNILTAMASAISAQLWTQPDATDQQNPDVWQVRHADEWDAGTVDLFRTFFKHHLDLINHFPMNAEREALIAATPIDEVKASGATLLDPINAVTGLILDLFKEGAATDNIVRIVEAHARYSRDIAGLPTPDQVSASSTTVSPKRRHVLATAGFYLHAYSIVGSTASIASTPQGAALMAQLAVAAQLLLSFIV